MQNVIDFITTNPIGIIITPLLMSLIGALLYDAAKKAVSTVNTKFKKKAIKSRIEKATRVFIDSYKAGYSSSHSTLHQVLFASEYILSIIRQIIIILVIGVFSIALIAVFESNTLLQIVILSIASISITIICLNVKETLSRQKLVSSIIFGDDYFKSEKKCILSFWKLKQKGLTDQEIFKRMDRIMTGGDESLE